MIVDFHNRSVEVLEVAHTRRDREGCIMGAIYLDTGEELSNYELDILACVRPDILRKHYKKVADNNTAYSERAQA